MPFAIRFLLCGLDKISSQAFDSRLSCTYSVVHQRSITFAAVAAAIGRQPLLTNI